MNKIVTANKVRMFNSCTRGEETEICNDERLAQLKGMAFLHSFTVEKVQHDEDQVRVKGGETPAFLRMWASV